MDLAIATIALVFIVAAWDSFRRYVDAVRFNQAVLDKLAEVERESARSRETVQNLLQKLQATQVQGRPGIRTVGR